VRPADRFAGARDLFLTETAQKADVVLPAAGWAEGDGTFTNLERRVQRAPKAVTDPKSRAAPDWMILTHLAKQMDAAWPFADARSVTSEIAEIVPGYAGLTWEALGDQGIQWDAESVAAATAAPTDQVGEEEVAAGTDADGEYPLTLVSGTVLYDGGTLFRLTEQMQGMAHGATVSLNPADAVDIGVEAGAPVRVLSDVGSLELTVAVDEQVQLGSAWIPESLPGAPVGALLNGGYRQRVRLERR